MRFCFKLIVLLTFFSCNKENSKSIAEGAISKNTIEKKIFIPEGFALLSQKYIDQKKQLINSFFDDKININNDFNGSFLVAKNGQILFEKYQGYSDFSKGKKINANTPIHIASVSKVLTASAIFRLVDAKKLKLDQTVKSILSNFPYEKITLRMLLNHRSGLAKYSIFTDSNAIWGRVKTLHNQDILNIIIHEKIALEFNPNSKFAYCNTNYAILALIIEKCTGKSFPTAMKELVFSPLKMNNTFVFEFEKQKDLVSQSYKSTKEIIKYDQLDAIYGDKNIYSTPQDLLKFDLATYSDAFISEELKAEIFKGYSYEKKGIKNYGLGIRLREWKTGQKVFYHNGWWHGNTTSYITLKNDTVTMIALSNKYNKKVYQTMKISGLFGDYPFEFNEEE